MTGKQVFSIVFVGVALILFAQYGNSKLALTFAGVILLASLVMNIDHIKGVFQ